MRKILIGLGVIVALVVAAALIAPSLVDWNSYKAQIAAEAKAATGRDLVIAGDLDLSVLPSLRLSANDVRFANIQGGSEPDMARLKALDIQVRLLPLLQGRFEAEAITLVEPVILLERLADGRVNWDLAPPGKARAEPVAGAPAAAPPPSRGGQAIQLDNLRIRRGTVVYRDAVAGTDERIAGLTAEISARSLSGPFHAKGDMTAHGVPLAFEAALGELQPTAAAPLNLLVTIPAADARAEVSGGAVIIGAAPRFTGKLNVAGRDLRRLAAALSQQPATGLPQALAQPFGVRARIKASETGGTVDNLEMELGGARASGTVSVTAGERLRTDAQLHVTRIDLDSWLGRGQDTPPGAGAAAPREPAAGDRAAGSAAPAVAPFALPDIDATVEARVDAVTYRRQNIRDIRARASLAGGTGRLETLAFFLPGGGEATVSGALRPRSGKPAFQGKMDVQADNLRAILGWLGADVEAVPSERLRKFAFSADLNADDEQLQLLGAKISVDTTRIDGGLTLALRDRPAFGATIKFDSLDLDAYLPREAAARRPAGPRGAAAAAGQQSGEAASAPAAPLAFLNDFDANLHLQANRLTVHKETVRDVRFDGTLVGGTMTVRNAAVGDIGGARAALSGTVGNFSGIPVFRGSVTADAKDAAEVLRLAGLSPPAGSLGALRLRGRADARADQVALDLTLDAAGASVRLAGTAAALAGTPRIDATLTAGHADLARLLGTLGVKTDARTLGPLKLTAELKGGLQQLSMNSRLEATGGTLTATGTVKDVATAPAYNLVLAAAHPSVGDLARLFAPSWRPAGGGIGPLKLNATVQGAQSTWTLSALTASAGAMTLQGNGALATGGARPKLTASLTAGDIDLNPFLPAEKPSAGQQQAPDRSPGQAGRRPVGVPGPGGGTQAPSEPFSSEPFDLSGLGVMDAAIDLGATSLTYRQFRVDRPVIKGTLADGLLTVQEIAGRMFDGAFRLAGRLDARETPAVEGTVTVEKANVGKALFQAAEFDIEGGITDFTMQAAGAGASPRAMVAALEGSGKLSSRDGVVKGFNLKAVSDRLKNLDQATDFLSLFGAAMEGGQTRFSSLDGTFRLDKGVLRSDDIRLVADAGEARATGFADLPRWHMDFNGQFRLSEHPKAPPFGMRVVGAINDPRRIFQFEKLQEFLLQRGIGNLLRRVLPNERQPQSAPQQSPQQQQQAPQQQQQPQPKKEPRLEDILPGLLEGLRR